MCTSSFAESCFTSDQPEGVLSDRDPQELAKVVEHTHGGCARSSLQEGSYHVEQHKGIEHLHSVTSYIKHTCTYG